MNAFCPRPQDGFALPVALMAMIVIGAIVTGGFYVSSQEHRVSLSTDFGTQAMHIAEYGLQEQFASLTTGRLRRIHEPGTQIESAYALGTFPVMNGSSPIGTFQVRVMPMGGRLWMVESEGRVERGPHTAVRRVGALSRTSTAELPFESAVTVVRKFVRAGSSRIHGEDACNLLNDAKPGVTALHADSVEGLKHGQQEAITGNPEVQPDDGVSADSLSQFGDVDLEELIRSATIRYTGTAASPADPRGMEPVTTTDWQGNTVCDPYPKTGDDNWGEPWDLVPECGDHVPIIYSDGPMHLRTGRGQGILIVEGDLMIDGNFQFEGVVIVTGKFIMQGGTNNNHGKINGSVIVHGNSEGESYLSDIDGTSGSALVQWDSCAVEKAMEGNLRIQPLRRGWVSDAARLP
jgi:hypothetical protein